MSFGLKVIVQDEPIQSAVLALLGVDRKIARIVGGAVQTEAKARAPVRTGFLRDNVELEVEGGIYTVESRAYYGGFVEFGTRKMAAQPYLYPAFEAVDAEGIATTLIHAIIG